MFPEEMAAIINKTPLFGGEETAIKWESGFDLCAIIAKDLAAQIEKTVRDIAAHEATRQTLLDTLPADQPAQVFNLKELEYRRSELLTKIDNKRLNADQTIKDDIETLAHVERSIASYNETQAVQRGFKSLFMVEAKLLALKDLLKRQGMVQQFFDKELPSTLRKHYGLPEQNWVDNYKHLP